MKTTKKENEKGKTNAVKKRLEKRKIWKIQSSIKRTTRKIKKKYQWERKKKQTNRDANKHHTKGAKRNIIRKGQKETKIKLATKEIRSWEKADGGNNKAKTHHYNNDKKDAKTCRKERLEERGGRGRGTDRKIETDRDRQRDTERQAETDEERLKKKKWNKEFSIPNFWEKKLLDLRI